MPTSSFRPSSVPYVCASLLCVGGVRCVSFSALLCVVSEPHGTCVLAALGLGRTGRSLSPPSPLTCCLHVTPCGPHFCHYLCVSVCIIQQFTVVWGATVRVYLVCPSLGPLLSCLLSCLLSLSLSLSRSLPLPLTCKVVSSRWFLFFVATFSWMELFPLRWSFPHPPPLSLAHCSAPSFSIVCRSPHMLPPSPRHPLPPLCMSPPSHSQSELAVMAD